MGANEGPPFRGVEWDDELEKRPECRLLIQLGLTRVAVWIAERAPDRPLTLNTLLDLHRHSFQGVFPEFAGRMRGPAPTHIPLNVSFGRYRGTPYEEVPETCATCFERIASAIGEIDSRRPDEDADWLTEQSLRVASYAHCELIRIHPFVNGNGRIARMCLNYFARRYGRRFVNIERPTGDYLDAIRTWIDRRVIDHFMDFLRPRWLPHPGDTWELQP